MQHTISAMYYVVSSKILLHVTQQKYSAIIRFVDS